jgi:ring-1,2-phenylacetyl-CoA epoxidase subunit PaaD
VTSSYDGEARRGEAPPKLPTTPPCPFCGGTDTELMNAFGSHASVSAYWCRACRSPFERMKWEGDGRRGPDGATGV